MATSRVASWIPEGVPYSIVNYASTKDILMSELSIEIGRREFDASVVWFRKHPRIDVDDNSIAVSYLKSEQGEFFKSLYYFYCYSDNI